MIETIKMIEKLGCEQNTIEVASACICLLQAIASEYDFDEESEKSENELRSAINCAKHEIWAALDANMGSYYATPAAVEAMKR
jgi:hypothetical protein